MSDDLFTAAAEERVRLPLAARMRPTTLDEVVGQDHLLAQGSPLRVLVEGDAETAPSSLILWGPPGTGKTTLAQIVSWSHQRRFVELSAVNATIKDVRAAVDEARRALGSDGRETVLFIDEVHRFSKTQQDALLPAVENRWVVLIAATTENPGFSVVSPLLSRSLLLTLRPLDDAAIATLVTRAVVAPEGLAGEVDLDEDAQTAIVRLAAGDARRALTALESAGAVARERHKDRIDTNDVQTAVDHVVAQYDRAGDRHYDVISAFIKSIRGSDVDAAMHYLAVMVEAGEDPRFIARRLVISASEDVGMADPTALLTAVAAADVVALVGMPEARIALAQAVTHLATAPKSNAAYYALGAAIEDVRAGRTGPVPVHVRGTGYATAERLGHGAGYEYPHDDVRGIVTQQYAPDVVSDREYYVPTEHGAEAAIAARLPKIRAILRGEPPQSPPVAE